MRGAVASGDLGIRVRPNPTDGEVFVDFSLPGGGPASVSVLDAAGRVVTSLARRTFPAGDAVVRWDGRDGAGRRVPAGIYWMRVEAQGRSKAEKIHRLDAGGR